MLVQAKVVEQAIKQTIAQVNPRHMFREDPPVDDYYPEADEVWDRISDLPEGAISTPEAIEGMLHDTFRRRFGGVYRPAPGLWTEAAKAIVAGIEDMYTHHYRT